MTKLNKIIKRESDATVFEKSKHRNIIITLEPPNLLGFRLKGTRRKYYLTSESCYVLALKAELMAQKKLKEENKK